MGARGAGGHLWGSEVFGSGGQPCVLVLLDASKSYRISWSRLLPRILTQAAPPTTANAMGTLMLSRSSKWMTLSWDLCRRKEVMLEL